MTSRIGNRFAPSHLAWAAMAETRVAARAVPGLLRVLAPIAAWAVVAVVMGAVVGFAAVILPPMGAFGIVAAVGLILLWVMPEVPLVYPALIRKAFYVMLIADLCVPYYYTVQFGDLPWVSIRRIATFGLIAPFLLAVASSSEFRRRIADRVRGSPLIVICAVGFLLSAIVSVSASPIPGTSLSALVDVLLSWYVPFLAILYLLRDKDDVVFILKILCFCAIFNTAAGVLEFYLQRRFFILLMPKDILDSLIVNNPALEQLLYVGERAFRNGFYRAASTFMTSLCFGEFEAILVPIGLFFVLHRQSVFERSLGWLVTIGGIVGIFVAGARGAYLGLIVSTATFVVIWSIRKALLNRWSLAPALVGLMGAISFVMVIAAILFWGKAHNLVLGGGAEASSTQARWDQFNAAWPLIKSNPITGNGFVTGGYDIGSSVDSYITSLLLETGVPGFVFFAGISLLPIWYGIRGYLTDLTESGALAGALACSFIAFTMYRIGLSQRENHMLIFSLLAIVVFLNYEYARKRVKEPRTYRARRGSSSGAEAIGLRTG
jgi:O-Antigen ligase